MLLSDVQAAAQFIDQYLRSLFQQFFALRPDLRTLISVDTMMLAFQTDVPVIPVRQAGVANTTVTIDFKTTVREERVVSPVSSFLAVTEAALEITIHRLQLTIKFDTTPFGTTKMVVVNYIQQPPPASASDFTQAAPIAVEHTGPSTNVETVQAPSV